MVLEQRAVEARQCQLFGSRQIGLPVDVVGAAEAVNDVRELALWIGPTLCSLPSVRHVHRPLFVLLPERVEERNVVNFGCCATFNGIPHRLVHRPTAVLLSLLYSHPAAVRKDLGDWW